MPGLVHVSVADDRCGLDHDQLLPLSERDAGKVSCFEASSCSDSYQALAMLRNRPNLPVAWQ